MTAGRRSIGSQGRLWSAFAALACLASLTFLPTQASAAEGWLAPADVSAADSGGGSPGVVFDAAGNATAIFSSLAGESHFVQVATWSAAAGWGEPVTVSPSFPSPVPAQLLMDSSGNAIAVWLNRSGPPLQRLEAATKPAGGSWSEPVVLSPAFSVPPEEFDAAIDANGDAVVIWSRGDNTPEVAPIIEAVSQPAGGAWSEPAVVATAYPWSHATPKVGIDATGEAVAVWQSAELLKFAAKPIDGAWSALGTIGTPGSLPVPLLAVDPAGEAIVTWRSNDGILAAVRRPGKQFGAPVDVTGDSTEYARGSTVAISPDGEAVVAWGAEPSAGSGSGGLKVATHKPGKNWAKPTTIYSALGSFAEPEQVAINDQGDAVVVWLKQNSETDFVEASTRPIDGSWGPPRKLWPPGQSFAPSVAIDPDGNALALWINRDGEAWKVQAAPYFKPAPTVQLTSTTPASPPPDQTPIVHGTAPAGATVKLFVSSTCSGTPLATGSGAALASTGLEIHVGANTTTQLYAIATEGSLSSSCSGPLSYSSQAAPLTMPEALAALPVLDSFAVAEEPLSREGAWATSWLAASTGFVATGGGWRSDQTFPGVAGPYWTPTAFVDTGTGTAVAARVIASPGLAKRYLSVWLDMPKPATNKSGYELRFSWLGNNAYDMELRSWTNGSPTSLGTVGDVVLPVGSDVALADRGGTLSAWADAGAGYVPLLSVPDSKFSAGYTGIATNGNGTRLRRFAAGALAVVSP